MDYVRLSISNVVYYLLWGRFIVFDILKIYNVSYVNVSSICYVEMIYRFL